MDGARPDGRLAALVSSCPSVGCLMSLCEENYRLLLRLAPGIHEWSGSLVSQRQGQIDLHLAVLSQSRFTTELRLTHWFDANWGDAVTHPEPDARLRAYRDARQVEVLELRQAVLPLRRVYAPPALVDKWQANLFLSKWLAFCLRQGHGFSRNPVGAGPAGCHPVVPSCLARP